MSIDADDVKKIANLARLAIDETDINTYANELSNILELVEQMNEVDTAEVTPMAHPVDMPQRLRIDEANTKIDREQFQKNAPNVEAGLYLVPKVIE